MAPKPTRSLVDTVRRPWEARAGGKPGRVKWQAASACARVDGVSPSWPSRASCCCSRAPCPLRPTQLRARSLHGSWPESTAPQSPLRRPCRSAETLPTGFTDVTVFSGLTNPTTVRFWPDGRIFIAEKSGLIKVFDGLPTTTPTVVADLGAEVYNYWDRGLLGLALDPSFPADALRLRALHATTRGSAAPRRRMERHAARRLPGPDDRRLRHQRPARRGCTLNGHDDRTGAGPDSDDWCQQFPSHSIGDLAFGPDGALYVERRRRARASTASTAANSVAAGHRLGNPCGDPPPGAGGPHTAPRPRGARSGPRAPAGPPVEPVLLNGSVIRIDPARARASRSATRSRRTTEAHRRRIVAYGLRNPFRSPSGPAPASCGSATSAGTLGGDRPDRARQQAGSADFGWPCYEGAGTSRATGRRPQPVRGALRGRDRRVALRHLQPHERWSRARPPHRQAARRSGGVAYYQRQQLSGTQPRRAILIRLRAQLHVGDVHGQQRASGREQDQCHRQRRWPSRRLGGRPEWRPLLRQTSRAGRSSASRTRLPAPAGPAARAPSARSTSTT